MITRGLASEEKVYCLWRPRPPSVHQIAVETIVFHARVRHSNQDIVFLFRVRFCIIRTLDTSVFVARAALWKRVASLLAVLNSPKSSSLPSAMMFGRPVLIILIQSSSEEDDSTGVRKLRPNKKQNGLFVDVAAPLMVCVAIPANISLPVWWPIASAVDWRRRLKGRITLPIQCVETSQRCLRQLFRFFSQRGWRRLLREDLYIYKHC